MAILLLPVPGGYRAPLYQLLANGGFNVDLVGSLTDNPAPSLPISDWYHEGHDGYRIDWVDAGLPTWSQNYANPDVVLVLLGANDFGQNYNTTNAINRLDKLISDIVAEYPKTRVIVANMLQLLDNTIADNKAQTQFNPYIPAVVATHQALGQRVFFLDMRSALGISDFSSDGVHPNQTGYNKMATNWFNAIDGILTPSMLNFNAGLATNLDFAILPSYYQPIPGLTVTCNNVGLYNGGPDHTTGMYGANNYNSCQQTNSVPGVFVFSKPVSIPSVWLTTFDGEGEVVTVNAYGDAAGSLLLTNFNFSTSPHPNGSNYVWGQCTQLAALGTNVMNVSFASTGYAQMDDMSVNTSTAYGPVQAVRLQLSLTNLTVSLTSVALVRADYQYASNVLVGAGDGVTFASSNPTVATVDGNGDVYAVSAGTTTVTATLQGFSSGQTVTVGNLIDFNVGLPSGLNNDNVPSTYQPIAGLIITYDNVALFNQGPDHTVGTYGGNNYDASQRNNAIPSVFVFSSPVSIPSVWLTTYDGSGESVIISAYADAARTLLLTNINLTMSSHPIMGIPQNGYNYIWRQCTGLAALGTNIISVSFTSSAFAQMDDMTVNEAIPFTPTSLKATANNGQVTLTWQPVSGATSYNVYGGTSSGGETFAYNDSTSPGSSAVKGMGSGTTYYFEVSAVNSSGESARSSEVSATPLAAPLDLSATANNGQVTLSWQPVSGATSYSLYGGTSSSGKAIITSVGGISYIDTGLANGAMYYFEVSAVNSSGESARSSEVSGDAAGGAAGFECDGDQRSSDLDMATCFWGDELQHLCRTEQRR